MFRKPRETSGIKQPVGIQTHRARRLEELRKQTKHTSCLKPSSRTNQTGAHVAALPMSSAMSTVVMSWTTWSPVRTPASKQLAMNVDKAAAASHYAYSAATNA